MSAQSETGWRRQRSNRPLVIGRKGPQHNPTHRSSTGEPRLHSSGVCEAGRHRHLVIASINPCQGQILWDGGVVESTEEQIRELLRAADQRHPELAGLLGGENHGHGVHDLVVEPNPNIDDYVGAVLDFADAVRAALLRVAEEVDLIKPGAQERIP